MKFIFPQNYSFNSKFLGLFDYKTAILNFIWFLIIFFICKLLNLNFINQIIIFIIICFPVFLFSIFSSQQENIIYIFYYIFIYFKRPKLYLYDKD